MLDISQYSPDYFSIFWQLFWAKNNRLKKFYYKFAVNFT